MPRHGISYALVLGLALVCMCEEGDRDGEILICSAVTAVVNLKDLA